MDSLKTNSNNHDTEINSATADEYKKHKNKEHQLPVNTVLHGRYLIGRVLGEGGFGITYEAEDLKLGCRVAIKEFFVSGQTTRTETLTVMPNANTKEFFKKGISRFLDEARVLAQFSDEPNIVHVQDYFEENGTGYIIMEFLDGQGLGRLLKKEGPMPFERVMELLEPAMKALDHVHKKGLIHRDISPENLMLLESGTVKVLDFGTARNISLTGEKSLTVMLKHGYAPEEQYRRNGEQGPWTDVYGMSATVYKLLTGQTPPPATDRMVSDNLVPPSKLGATITPKQEQALLRGLAVNAKDRIRSMEELAQCLNGSRKLKPRRKKPKKAVIAAAAAVVVLLGGIGAVWRMNKDDGATPEPEATDSTDSTGGTGSAEAAQPEKERTGRWVLGEEELCIKKTELDGNGDINLVEDYEYDEYGSKTASLTTCYIEGSADYTYSNRWSHKYGNDGSRDNTEYIYTSSDGTVTRTEYRMEYREEENAEVRCKYVNGIFDGWTVSEDNEEREGYSSFTAYHYYPDGVLEQYYVYETFTQGDDVTRKVTSHYDNEGNLQNQWEKDFDENGNLIHELNKYVNSGMKNEISYELDSDGKCISSTRVNSGNGDGDRVYKSTYEYEKRQVYHWEWDE